MHGNVEGGVLRMLKNMEHESPLNRQLSRKWVESSKQIIGKIVDPVYKELTEVKEEK